MTTVAQMIEWMKTMPQDAEVEIYNTDTSETVPVDIESCEVVDCTTDSFKPYPHVYGRVFVQIMGQ